MCTCTLYVIKLCTCHSFAPPTSLQVALGQSFTIAISEDMTRVFGCGKADHGVLGQRAISGDHHILFVSHSITQSHPHQVTSLYHILTWSPYHSITESLSHTITQSPCHTLALTWLPISSHHHLHTHTHLHTLTLHTSPCMSHSSTCLISHHMGHSRRRPLAIAPHSSSTPEDKSYSWVSNDLE